MSDAAKRIRGLVEKADPLPWDVAWHAQRQPIARAESTHEDTDGKAFGLYAACFVPVRVDISIELARVLVNASKELCDVLEAADDWYRGRIESRDFERKLGPLLRDLDAKVQEVADGE